MFGKPDIDLFASRSNKKCNKYLSWKNDPLALATDAFTKSWRSYFFYPFPPFSITGRILNKIKSEVSRGILVFPYWLSHPFFPLCMSMLESEPLVFKPKPNLVCSSDRTPHPLWQNLSLAAEILCDKH